MKRYRYVVLPVFLLFLTACDSFMPSGFWKGFEKSFQLKDHSDQGPWGGHRAMHWKSLQGGTFNANKMIEFARKNGWILVDSAEYKGEALQAWSYFNQAIFPLSHTGFEPAPSENISTYADFPRWISENVRLYKFNTDWITVMPGEEESNPAYGYVIINQKQNEMSVYHLWGE